MSNEILEKFSEELKSAREKKKIKLEQIFNKTRIDIKYLEAIESGNFSIMPDVYIRAFLKEYAEYIGLNSNEILERYKLAQSGKLYNEQLDDLQEQQDTEIVNESKPEFVSEDLEEKSAPVVKNNSVNYLYYIFASIVMLIFIYFIYDSFLSDKSINNTKEKPFAEVLKSQEEPVVKNDIIENKSEIDVNNIKEKKIENIKATTSPKETALIEEIKKNKGNLTLTILGEGKSWMRVVVDGNKNNEFIIDQGIKRELFANEKFYLHIGNSAGVKLFLNGKELYFKKAEGRVKKFNVTKNGIEYIKRKVVQQNEN